MIEPIQRTAPRTFHPDPWPSRRTKRRVPLTSRQNLIPRPIRQTNRFLQSVREFFEVFQPGGSGGAGVAVRVEDFLAVAVQVEEADEVDVVVLCLVASPGGEGGGFGGGEGFLAWVY